MRLGGSGREGRLAGGLHRWIGQAAKLAEGVGVLLERHGAIQAALPTTQHAALLHPPCIQDPHLFPLGVYVPSGGNGEGGGGRGISDGMQGHCDAVKMLLLPEPSFLGGKGGGPEEIPQDRTHLLAVLISTPVIWSCIQLEESSHG